MKKPFPVIFGAVIALILLLLYTVSWGYMIMDILNCRGENCSHEYGKGVIYVVTTVGGLVSALVIAKLAITKPGENPGIMKIAEDGNGTTNTMATTIAICYLAVWLLTGLAALIVGTMLYPDANKTVSDIGTTWLGLAVAAGYSYFGIQPS